VSALNERPPKAYLTWQLSLIDAISVKEIVIEMADIYLCDTRVVHLI